MVVGSSITFTLNTDNFGQETSWDLKDGTNQILYSEGLNTYADASTFVIDMCVPDNDCYTFTIYDDFGDGICCGEGQGSYSIEDENGIILAEGGNFGSQESSSFCLPTQPALPYASFSANNTTICSGFQVTYTNLDTNQFPTNYFWLFEGGSPNSSSDPNPVIVYNNPGTYDVTLYANNTFGNDTSDLSDFITVVESPGLSLSSTIETNGQNNGSATVVASGGTPPYSFAWSRNGLLVGTGATYTDMTGTTNFSLARSVQDAAGFTDDDSRTVTVTSNGPDCFL
jgi:PKD repeat protein